MNLKINEIPFTKSEAGGGMSPIALAGQWYAYKVELEWEVLKQFNALLKTIYVQNPGSAD